MNNHVSAAEPVDMTDFNHIIAARTEQDKKWRDAWIDPTEFTGIADTEDRFVSVDYPLEVFDVSGGVIKTKIKEELLEFDVEEFDVIELVT